MRVLTIIIDGCNENYINKDITPFLYSLKEQGAYSVASSSACFDNRREIISGRYPVNTDTFVDFCYSPSKSPFRFFKKALNRGDIKIKPRNSLIRKILIKWSRLIYGIGIDFVNIPTQLLSYFSQNTSIKKLSRDEKKTEGKQLFGILREKGINTNFIYGTTEHINRSLKDYSMADEEFLVIHYGDTDKVGHKYGPDSLEIQSTLKAVSSSVEGIVNNLEDLDYVIIASDHNMVKVEEYVDLWGALMKLKSRVSKDYFVFLNSPLARFWFKNDKAKKEITEFLETLDSGKIVNEDDLLKMNLPVDKKYGEIIFWLKSGFHIYPDFYQAEKIKGMHGYAYDDIESPFIVYSSDENKVTKLKDKGRLVDIAPTILDLFNVKYDLMDGESLIRK